MKILPQVKTYLLNLKREKDSIALTEEIKQHISQSVAVANQHADTGDNNTLNSARSYTDQKVQAEAQAGTKKPLAQLVEEGLVPVPESKKLNEVGTDFVAQAMRSVIFSQLPPRSTQ